MKSVFFFLPKLYASYFHDIVTVKKKKQIIIETYKINKVQKPICRVAQVEELGESQHDLRKPPSGRSSSGL